MNVDRLSVTMGPTLGSGVRAAAARQGKSVSAWMAEAAADRLRNQLVGDALNAWEDEHGAFSTEELADARASLLGKSQRGEWTAELDVPTGN